MPIRITIILTSLLLLLAACVPTTPLEDLAIINTRGVDISEENRNQIETTILSYQFDSQSQDISQILSGKGKTIKSARENASRETGFNLSPGQIRLELYGKEAAQNGILQYVSSAVRDARVSETMLLAITNSSAKEILTEGQEGLSHDFGKYLYNLIEKEIDEDSIPNIYLHEFTHFESDIGQDPVVPIIELEEGKPKISGIALFQGDKYVDEISFHEGYLVNLMQKTTKSTPYEISVPMDPFVKYIDKKRESIDEDDLYLNVNIVKAKSKTKLKNAKELHFDTTINIKLNLLETSALLSVRDEGVANLLKREIERDFKQQYATLLTKLQEAGSDPFGLGTIYRAKKRDRPLTDEEWREKLPDVTVDFHINVELTNYGGIQ